MGIINKLLCGLLILMFTNLYSQQMPCQWVNYSNTIPSYINDACVDLNGNSLALGYFKDINIQGVSLTSNPPSAYNIFISKTDASGNLLWLKLVAEGNECRGKSILTDNENNIIFTGYFTNFITLCDTTLIDSSIVGEFIIKMDQNGNCLWMKYVDFVSSSGPIPIVIDNNDNIYMLTTGNTIISGVSCNGNTVMTKFNKYGQIKWMKSTSIKLNDMDRNNTVALYSKNIYIGGYYGDSINFAGNNYIPGIEISINPFNGDTSYITTRESILGIMDTSGTEITAVNITSTRDFNLEAVTANGFGDVFVSGKYASDSIHIGCFSLVGSKRYLAKFSSELVPLIAKNINSGNLLGAMTSNYFTYYSFSSCISIKKYDFNCNFVDSLIFGNNNLQPELGIALAKYPDNTFLLAGDYVDELMIDSLLLPGNPYLEYKMFIARFKDLEAGIKDISTSDSIVLYPNPTSGVLFISPSDFYKIELYNMNGALIKENFKDKEINIEDISNGVYFIKIIHKNNVITRKLIKQ